MIIDLFLQVPLVAPALDLGLLGIGAAGAGAAWLATQLSDRNSRIAQWAAGALDRLGIGARNIEAAGSDLLDTKAVMPPQVGVRSGEVVLPDATGIRREQYVPDEVLVTGNEEVNPFSPQPYPGSGRISFGVNIPLETVEEPIDLFSLPGMMAMFSKSKRRRTGAERERQAMVDEERARLSSEQADEDSDTLENTDETPIASDVEEEPGLGDEFPDDDFKPKDSLPKAEKIGEGAGKAAEKIGEGAGKAAEKIGKGAGKAAEKIGKGAGKAAEKIGEGTKSALKSAAKSAKTNGRRLKKVGKVALWSAPVTGGVLGFLSSMGYQPRFQSPVILEENDLKKENDSLRNELNKVNNNTPQPNNNTKINDRTFETLKNAINDVNWERVEDGIVDSLNNQTGQTNQ